MDEFGKIPPSGPTILEEIEHDLEPLWARWGIENMPRLIRMNAHLYRGFKEWAENTLGARVTMEEWHYGTARSSGRAVCLVVDTLYGQLKFVRDPALPDGVWVIDHVDAWKRRLMDGCYG